jgi:transcriptional regulator with PAS, ATPase and Fis domain
MGLTDSPQFDLVTGYKPSGHRLDFSEREPIEELQGLLAAFSGTSAIGFAVVDDQLRYLAINKALAAMTGVPAAAHLGKTIRDILGDVATATQIENTFRTVFGTGRAVLQAELKATLPTRTAAGYWIRNCYPIHDRAGKVKQVVALVVEVTAQRKLDDAIGEFTGKFLHKHTTEHFWLARELHDSINQYHAALATSLDCLSQRTEKPEIGIASLAQSVESLDQRIVAMQNRVSDVASIFTSDR